VIFKKGADDRRMFLVLDGSVKIYTQGETKEIEIAVIEQYEFFGEIELYVEKPRTDNAKAVVDSRLVVIRSPSELERFTMDNPWLSGKMMATMGVRQAATNTLLAKKLANASKGGGVDNTASVDLKTGELHLTPDSNVKKEALDANK
jgi:CRP-like cAMP-binding protein